MAETGIIFDFDGTIVLSEPVHAAAWADMAAHFGRELPAGFIERGIGSTDALLSEMLALEWGEGHTLESVLECKRRLYRARAAREVCLVPGAAAALAALSAEHPLALATSSSIGDVEACFQCHNLAGHFRAVLTMESVRAHKPHPEVYLLAAERLGVAPERCWVFEDSATGATAARAAGMKVIGVTTTFGAEVLGPVVGHVPHFEDLEAVVRLLRGTAEVALAQQGTNGRNGRRNGRS